MSSNRSGKTFIFFVFLSILVLSVLWGCYLMFAHIDLYGDSEIILNYMEEYKEEGFSATRLNKDISDDVIVKGHVNSKKLGTYKISYEIDGLFGKKVVRTINVVDRVKPVMELGDNKEIYLCPGSEYIRENIKALDNYDGDISDKVIIDVSKDKVIYSVKDSSGNKSIGEKSLIFEDKIKPVITINGSPQEYAFVGEGYSDKGSSASDNCSGNISKNIKVSSNVDPNKTGIYEVKYSVSDGSGNSTSVTRKVVISKRNQPGTIYLTFDDGPQWGTTDKILDILKEEGVEATFFVTNKGPDELIKRMYDEGHTVALHTASHDYAKVYLSVDAYFNDLNSVSNRVERITGEKSTIIRFPGGSSNTVSRKYCGGIMSTLTKEVVNRGYKYYDWNISSGDAAGGRPSATDIRNNVVNNLRKNRVNMVLMHDVKTWTRDALREIIRYGKNNGYTFEKITMDTEMVKQRVNN